jgi:uncharacterized protein YraI
MAIVVAGSAWVSTTVWAPQALAATPVTHYNCPNGPALGHYVPANRYWEQNFTAQGTSITGGWLLLGANTGDHDHTAKIGIYTGSNRSGPLAETYKQVSGYDGEDFAFPAPIPVTPGQQLYVAVTGVGDFTAYDQVVNGIDGCFIGRIDGFAGSSVVPPPPPPPPAAPPPPPPPPPPPASFRYAIANVVSVNLRAGPGTSYQLAGRLAGGTPIDIVCQTMGENVNGSAVWDKLSTGTYVSDWYTTTPAVGAYSPGIPQCAGAPAPTPGPSFHITATISLSTRTGPGTNHPVAGSLAPGAGVNIVCQTYGTYVNGSPVWDKLDNGQFVTDYYVSTPTYAYFSDGLAVCPGTGARPSPPAGGGGGGGSSGGGAGSIQTGSGPGTSSCAIRVLLIAARGSDEGSSGAGEVAGEVGGAIHRDFDGAWTRNTLNGIYEATLHQLVTAPDLYIQLKNRVAENIATAVRTAVNNRPTPCRPLQIVLSGYSFGAWAVGDAVNKLGAYRSSIKAVVLFGDPGAPRGVALDRTVSGAPVHSYCRSLDIVCDFEIVALGGAPAVAAALGLCRTYKGCPHLRYESETAEAGDFITTRLKQ